MKKLENERVFEFLVGLNRELDDVRGRILSQKPLPSSREVFAEVRREENRWKVMINGLGGVVVGIGLEASGLNVMRNGPQINEPSTNVKDGPGYLHKEGTINDGPLYSNIGPG